MRVRPRRPGTSAPAPAGHRTALTQVADLRALLAAARIPGPYVVVGHSWGGALAELFASRYRSDDRGRRRPRSVLPVGQASSACCGTAGASAGPVRRIEHVDLLASIRQLEAVRTLGSLPLVVVQHGSSPVPAEAAAWNRRVGSPLGRRRPRGGDEERHAIPARAPAVAVAAIRGVVAAVRATKPLASCPELFADLPARCLAR